MTSCCQILYQEFCFMFTEAIEHVLNEGLPNPGASKHGMYFLHFIKQNMTLRKTLCKKQRKS
jgi:hypothetical protein